MSLLEEWENGTVTLTVVNKNDPTKATEQVGKLIAADQTGVKVQLNGSGNDVFFPMHAIIRVDLNSM